jgi:tripartite-type tricarboxylate transporter receptor subunit TctC
MSQFDHSRKRTLLESAKLRIVSVWKGLPAMKLPRRRFLHLAASAAALPIASRTARADAYPTRPITLIVPFTAGGPTDTVGRILAEGMRPSLGQTVVIENVAGAAGSIGIGRVARAPPDGYTVGLGFLGTHVINAVIYSLPYNPVNDFEPVALLATNPFLILANKALAANDLHELIAWLKAHPNQASQGTAGLGSPSHVAGAMFQQMTGTKFQFVPYRGAGPAMQDLVAGRVELMFDQVASALPQVRAGAIKAYAVTSNDRWSNAPDIPTVDEAGLPDLHISIWHGLWAPKGTPKEIIAKLNAAVVTALADPLVRQRLAELGQEIPPRDQQTPEGLSSYQKAEIERWWPIIRAANIKAE